MAKTHKRVLSLILSLVMVLSLLPIQALAAVSISCTASDGAVITVTGDIPENAVVTAVPVPVELEGMKTLGAYDINITVDGAAWQPESPVEVSIESPAFEGYEELSVFHVDTDQALDYIDQYFGFLEQIMNFIKGLFSRKISSDEVSFMAEHFSIYAVGVPYVATYQFYDGPAGTDAQIIDSATQILKAGEAVQLPAAPAGDGIFQGWYIDGTTPLDGSYQVPELSADVTYNVYPKFDGVYYVYFLNENGQVVETIQTSAGETTEVSTEVASFVPTGNFKLVGWTLKKDGQDIVDSVSEADVTTDGAVYLYPVLHTPAYTRSSRRTACRLSSYRSWGRNWESRRAAAGPLPALSGPREPMLLPVRPLPGFRSATPSRFRLPLPSGPPSAGPWQGLLPCRPYPRPNRRPLQSLLPGLPAGTGPCPRSCSGPRPFPPSAAPVPDN